MNQITVPETLITFLFYTQKTWHLWWSSKGAWRAPCAAEMDEGMEASWKALASNGRWKRWYDFL